MTREGLMVVRFKENKIYILKENVQASGDIFTTEMLYRNHTEAFVVRWCFRYSHGKETE